MRCSTAALPRGGRRGVESWAELNGRKPLLRPFAPVPESGLSKDLLEHAAASPALRGTPIQPTSSAQNTLPQDSGSPIRWQAAGAIGGHRCGAAQAGT